MGLEDMDGLGEKVEDDGIVSVRGKPSSEQASYLKELEGVVTPAYISVVKKAFPWLSGLTVSRDDETHDWFAVFDRDGTKEAVALEGTTFPQFADDFVRCVKKHLGDRVDRTAMEKLGEDLAEFDEEE